MFWVYVKPRAQGFIFCLVFIAQEVILCVVGVILNPSSFSLRINNPLLFVSKALKPWAPLSLITDITSSDATACIMALQDERIDGGFKTRLPGGLREMTLSGKRGLYLLMSVTKDESKSHSRGSGCHNIFFLGEGEGRRGKRKNKRERERFLC